MLEFKKPELCDMQWVNSCLAHANSLNCEYTFGNLFCWSDSYSVGICRYNDFFICRWGDGKNVSYSVPLGEGDFTDAIKQIIDDAKSIGANPKIYGITEGYLLMLQEAFLGEFGYKYDLSFNDYIYSAQKMASLSGKKYHGKRNHITNFKKNNPDWTFEKITKENIKDCIDMHKEWLKENGSRLMLLLRK